MKEIQDIIGAPIKENYYIDPELKIAITCPETKEEIEAYFADLALCMELGICSDCGQPVVFDETYNKEYIKEYSISALCKSCQNKTFGF